MLLDFDWAGPIQETYYPMYVHRKNIPCPDGARDGKKISAKHALDMLNYLFHSEQDGREPAAKRRRTSLSTGEVDSFIIRIQIYLKPACFVFHKAIIQ
jgi:hypothetical protein